MNVKTIASFIIGIALAVPVHGDECRDVLNKCDAALHAEIDLNVAKQGVIDDQAALISVLKTDLDKEALWKPIAIGAAGVVVLETIIIILRK